MSRTEQPRCGRTERVAEYALRSLPPDEVSAFETHVNECAECREELADLRPIIESFVDWPIDILRPSSDLWGRISQRIAPGAAVEPEARWPDEPQWREVAPGISCKLLASDASTGRVSMLVRLAPGIAYPPHSHADVEELHLLDGELWIEDRLLRPGDYNRAEPGTADQRVWSETGCTCVLITSSRDVLQ